MAGGDRRLIARLAQACLWLAGVCLLAMAVIGGLDAALANLDWLGLEARALPSAREATGLLLVAAVFLALPATQLAGRQIRITLSGFGDRPGWVGTALALMRLAMTAAVFGAFAVQGWAATLRAAEIGRATPGLIPLPLWPAQGALALGATVVALVCLAQAAALVRTGKTGP